MGRKNNNNNIPLSTRIITDETPFAIREAFNQLRTNLMYTVADSNGESPVFAVTSTNENAGKSTIIVNLAISFAQLNKKVLLIDSDMRCPVIHRYFELDGRGKGLSEIISGMVSTIPKHSVMPNLDVITSGHIPPNPSELITSPHFAEHIEEWKKEYDIIFIDFPPIGIVTDCIANRDIVTAYVFVVRSGKCSAKNINSSIETMEQVGAKIAGIILNDYNIKISDRYKYKSSRYSKQAMSRYESSSKLRDKHD